MEYPLYISAKEIYVEGWTSVRDWFRQSGAHPTDKVTLTILISQDLSINQEMREARVQEMDSIIAEKEKARKRKEDTLDVDLLKDVRRGQIETLHQLR